MKMVQIGQRLPPPFIHDLTMKYTHFAIIVLNEIVQDI